MGRPTKYTEELADRILKRIEANEPLYRICDEPGMPDKTTVIHWLRIIPNFSPAYSRARVASADRKVEEIEEIADDPLSGISHEAVGHARLRIETRKWVASKLKPAVYGDKLDVSGDLTLSIKVVRFGDAADAALDVTPQVGQTPE